MEKIVDAEVLDRFEGKTYGVVLWKRDREGFVEFGTHEYRIDNPDSWYLGHYFGRFSEGDEAGTEYESEARSDFEKRASTVANEARAPRREAAPKGPDQELGTVSAAKTTPPESAKGPKIDEVGGGAAQKTSEPTGRRYEALIDGNPVASVFAKSPKDADDQIFKELSTNPGRREFFRLWVAKGSKIRVAESKRTKVEAGGKRTPVDIADVAKVYSGRPGCMCGCRGKYTAASKFRDLAGKARGYTFDDSEVSDRSVKIVVDKINAMINDESVEWDQTEQYTFVDTGTRYYAAYYASYMEKTAAKKAERKMPKSGLTQEHEGEADESCGKGGKKAKKEEAVTVHTPEEPSPQHVSVSVVCDSKEEAVLAKTALMRAVSVDSSVRDVYSYGLGSDEGASLSVVVAASSADEAKRVVLDVLAAAGFNVDDAVGVPDDYAAPAPEVGENGEFVGDVTEVRPDDLPEKWLRRTAKK